jgi:hypothetical protein
VYEQEQTKNEFGGTLQSTDQKSINMRKIQILVLHYGDEATVCAKDKEDTDTILKLNIN